VSSNADLTAGTATFKVTDNDTELVNGPAPVLSDLVQQASAVARVGIEPIAAGAQGRRFDHVTDASYAPTTADLTRT
jgi:hypothetical protein